jgi:hypothetical protein
MSEPIAGNVNTGGHAITALDIERVANAFLQLEKAAGKTFFFLEGQ